MQKLYHTGTLAESKLKYLLENFDEKTADFLFEKAREVQHKYFSNKIYVRGLIEFTNYCKNDCYYCGIRRSNLKAVRYRLSKEEILSCATSGYALGFRTFVLQGGEDGYFTDDKMVDIISSLKNNHPDCAITLSIGEKGYESYLRFFEAGADRYLLRHETANAEHYAKLHPQNLLLKNRKACLEDLKKIGYQVGTGFMVGSPYQTTDDLVKDLLFIKDFQPEMIGIGPFLPHRDTPFAEENAGTAELTLFFVGILRLMNPNSLIPSTTALGTVKDTGRERGILAGANVVMPNLSPVSVRKKYMLYDNKICTGEEAAEGYECLRQRMRAIGYEMVVDRGDYKPV
ncbi:MAG: [FeFe] hydrogenase H-cluster radical SAM maturase HydE [Clostridia bacterium]|nr:[FeFe] hydrogenase H-cluster radical SAM maturase HydE [Clostridia bacterium]